jgi:putative serine protease PepD
MPYAPPAGPGSPRRTSRGGFWPLVLVAVIAALVGAAVAGGIVSANKKTSSQNIASTNSPSSAPSNQPAVSLPAGSVAQVAHTLLPSVVSIIVSGPDSADEGTGIVLTADGAILTNNHVVEAAASSGTIAVTINDGRTVKATIVGRDPTSDLAVIKAAGVTDLHPATFGSDSSLTVGQPVIAIGSPLGLSNTVTSGIVSSLNRPICTQNCAGSGPNAPTPTVLDAIQTDAAINPGNSGGPLVDMSGRVVGVNSAIATLDQGLGGSNAQSGSIGVGFAIPIDEASRVADQLVKTGHADHAVIGIGLQDSVEPTLHTPNGAKVVKVNSGGPAAKAGLRVNDVIVKIGNRTVADADSLIAATHAAIPNSTVSITYMRNGQQTTVQVTLSSAPST